jgi:hypothetical protein
VRYSAPSFGPPTFRIAAICITRIGTGSSKIRLTRRSADADHQQTSQVNSAHAIAVRSGKIQGKRHPNEKDQLFD